MAKCDSKTETCNQDEVMDRKSILTETEREKFRQEIMEQVRDFCARCRREPPDALASEYLSEARAREHLVMLETLLGRPLKGTSLLEIGAGYGMFVAAARLLEGAESYGIEPGTDVYMSRSIGQRVLVAAGIGAGTLVFAKGESLPFREGSFDVVYSSNVLEHVRDPEALIHEGFRALKPGGRLVYVIPNYRSFWEGHYRLPWFPVLNRLPLGRFYVRLMGRDPAFLDTLQFITPSMIRRWVSTLPGDYRLVTMGEELCAERLRTMAFGSWGGLDTVKRIVRVVQWMRITELVIKFLKSTEAYTPIVLVLEKTAP